MSEVSVPSNRPVSATPPRRGKRALKWGLGAVVVLVAAVAAAPFLLSTSWARNRIVGWLEENVERKVEFSNLDVSWTEGIRLDDLVVKGDSAGDPPVLVAPHVILRASLFPLFFRKLDVKEFVIEDPVVTLTKDDDGDVNANRVLKKRKPRRKREDSEQETVLPEIRVPIDVKNLTLVFRRADGLEARTTGITFKGKLTTRDGPTTFDLRIPDGASGEIHATGSVVMLDDAGVVLPKAEWKIDAVVVVRGVDARANRDLLRLFLDEVPAAGIVDARLEVQTAGRDATGVIDLKLRGLAVGDAVARRAGAAPEDLTAHGKFEKHADRFKLEGLQVRADGLTIDADLGGTWPEKLEGKAKFDADFARMQSSLAAMGVDMRGKTLAGRAVGDVTFTPAAGTGAITLTNFRTSGFVEGGAPVTVDKAEITFRTVPSEGGLRLETLDAKLPDLTAHAEGGQTKDGDADYRATAKGDLGALLARVRDLGFLPQEFSVNGTLDAAVHVTGRSESRGGKGHTIQVERLLLTEQDVKIEAAGTIAGDGAMDFAAKGEGDLGKLLGRVRGGSGGAVRGGFSFDAAAKGPAKAVVVTVPRFQLDGDFAVNASGEYRPDGSIGGKLSAKGRVEEALALARRLGFSVDLPLEGTLDADAEFRGTADKPEVPKFTLKLVSAPLTLDANGSIGADKVIRAKVTGGGDVARMGELAVKMGAVKSLPPLRGHLTLDVDVAGTTDGVAVPRATLTLRGGPADVDVAGSLDAGGRISGTATVDGALAEIGRFAHEAGWTERAVAAEGRVKLVAVAGGTKDRWQVSSADLTISGPLTLTAKGSFEHPETLHAAGSFRGALQPLLDIASQATGSEPRQLAGTVEGQFRVDGPLSKLDASVPNLVLRSGSLDVTAKGSRTAAGDIQGNAAVRGGVDELLRVLGAFGVASDMRGTGTIDAALDAKTVKGRTEGNVSATVTNLVVTDSKDGTEAFREARATFVIPRVVYDSVTGRLEPMDVNLKVDGAVFEAKADMTAGPPDPDGTPQKVLTLDGRAKIEESFAASHPDIFGEGVVVTRADLPFRFKGDIAHGRANAAAWTGGFEGTVAGFRTENFVAEDLVVTGKLDAGVLRLSPVKGKLNKGTLDAKIAIGLVGEFPSHQAEIDAKDVVVDGALAKLVAKISPLFAGEEGRAGGTVSATMNLTAQGKGVKKIEKTLNGKGVLDLAGAYVESNEIVGAVLSLLGGSSRMEFQDARVPFTVVNGRVHTEPLLLQAVGLALKMGGDVQLDTKAIDYTLGVKTTSGGGGSLSKYLSFLDKDGYLPLRIGGSLSKPKVKAPDLKDAIGNKLEDLVGGLFGGKDDKDEPDDPPAGGTRKPRREDPPPPPDDGGKGKGKGGKGKGGKKGDGKEPPASAPGEEAPPPPPPKKGDAPPPPPAKDEPPPAPPANEEPPPPPPRK